MLYRDRWIAGLPLFVDISIANYSQNNSGRLELAIEQTVTRLSDEVTRGGESTEKHVVARKHFQSTCKGRKVGTWDGLRPNARDERTRTMDVPKGLATIAAGLYANVNYDTTTEYIYQLTDLEHTLELHASM